MRRFILIPLALVLLLLVAAVVLVPLFLDEDKILELAASTLREQTGATLTVAGETKLSVFPVLGISLSDAAITLPGKVEPDLTVKSLSIGVQLMPLISGRVDVNAITLDGLTAKIETAPEQPAVDTSSFSDNELDEFYVQRRKEKKDADAAAGAETALEIPLTLSVQQLKITNASLELVDPEAATPTIIEMPSLQASDLNLDGRAIPLDIALRLPGAQVIDVGMKGSVRVDLQKQNATLDELSVVITGVTAAPLHLHTRGVVNLARQIADLNLELELGDMHGKGTLRYASYESPQIDTKLQLNLFDPVLLALAGPDAAAQADNSTATSGDEPLPLDALRSIDTRAVLSIKQAKLDVHTVNDLQVNVRAVDGVIELDQLTGELHGGQLDAQATFNAKHTTAKLSTKGSLKGLNIANVLTATGSDTEVTGTASLDWQLKSKGRTTNELTAALKGPVQLDTQEVVLQGTSVEKLICQTVALTNKEQLSTTFPTSTRFETLGASIQFADGKAKLKPLQAQLPQVGLKGRGSFDLLSQDFAMSFKASLSPTLEELDRACRVSKRLTAIDWPVNCKGNTSTDPADWCSVDAEEIIQDLAVNEGRDKLKKKAGKFLDKLFKKSD
jgi:AsmA protein